MTTSNEIVKVEAQRTDLAESLNFMPVMAIEQVRERYNAVVNCVKMLMKPGTDYGIIPGTSSKNDDGTPSNGKNTLLKPGAEKLCTLFGLVPEFEDYRVIENWETGLFYYAYRCRLMRRGFTVATYIGSCNSREKKYRRAARICPECSAATIKRSKFPPKSQPEGKPGWYCYEKAGGCGRQFDADDPSIAEQSLRDDPSASCDLINTIQKMAQKRALLGATLIATNASEFFTQDMEDLEIIDVEGNAVLSSTPTPQTTPPSPNIDQRPEWEIAADAALVALQARGYAQNEAERKLASIYKTTGVAPETAGSAWWESIMKAITSGRADKTAKPPAPPMAGTPETTTPHTPEPKPATPTNWDFWQEFKSSWLTLAASKHINLTVAAEALKKAVRNVGMRGSEAQIPSVTTTLWYSALEADAFDLDTGRVNQVKMVLATDAVAAGA